MRPPGRGSFRCSRRRARAPGFDPPWVPEVDPHRVAVGRPRRRPDPRRGRRAGLTGAHLGERERQAGIRVVRWSPGLPRPGRPHRPPKSAGRVRERRQRWQRQRRNDAAPATASAAVADDAESGRAVRACEQSDRLNGSRPHATGTLSVPSRDSACARPGPGRHPPGAVLDFRPRDCGPQPRSRTVTDGIEATTSRGMLRAVGMGDEDWDKPQIGVASSWNEITPCNLSSTASRRPRRRGLHRWRLPAPVRHDLCLRRHLDGPRGHALLLGQP